MRGVIAAVLAVCLVGALAAPGFIMREPGRQQLVANAQTALDRHQPVLPLPQPTQADRERRVRDAVAAMKRATGCTFVC